MHTITQFDIIEQKVSKYEGVFFCHFALIRVYTVDGVAIPHILANKNKITTYI